MPVVLVHVYAPQQKHRLLYVCTAHSKRGLFEYNNNNNKKVQIACVYIITRRKPRGPLLYTRGGVKCVSQVHQVGAIKRS